MPKDENGYIVVETVGTFIPFVLLVVSILSLVNIVSLQARVHNALTQAAGSISMYCYILNATGAADTLMTIGGKAQATAESISAVMSGIETLSGDNSPSAGEVYDGNESRRTLTVIGETVDDFKTIIQNFTAYEINELRNLAAAAMVRPMIGRYLAGDGMTFDEYLGSAGVVSFEIADCEVIDRNGDVKLTAEYEIEYTFGALKLPFGPTLKVTQTVVTKAWLGGSGEGYRW